MTIPIGPGCVLDVPANLSSIAGPLVAFYNFDVGILNGCVSFADVVTSPAFESLAARVAVSVFSNPLTITSEEGYLDPIGYVSTYTNTPYKLVVVNESSGFALLALGQFGNVSVAVDGDQGNWVSFAAAHLLPYKVIYGLFYWGIAVFSCASIVMSILAEGRSYSFAKYNNAIYWCCFTGSTLLALQITIDFGAFNGVLTLGQWQILHWIGLVTTCWMTPLLISAWARVVSNVPVAGVRSHWAVALQVFPIACQIFVTVLTYIAVAKYTLLQAYGTTFLALAYLLAIGGAFNFLLCVSAIVFGMWLLSMLYRFQSAHADITVHYKTTALMLTSVLNLLCFTVIMTILNSIYLTPEAYFIIEVFELVFIGFTVIANLVSLRVTSFKFSSHSGSNLSMSNRSPAFDKPKSATLGGSGSGSGSDRAQAPSESRLANADDLVISLQQPSLHDPSEDVV